MPTDTVPEGPSSVVELVSGDPITSTIDAEGIGDISVVGVDKDWYKINVTEGEYYTLSATAGGGDLTEVVISLYNIPGDGDPVDAKIREYGYYEESSSPSYTFYAAETTYFVAISAGGETWKDDTGSYQLTLTEIPGGIVGSTAVSDGFRFPLGDGNITPSETDPEGYKVDQIFDIPNPKIGLPPGSYHLGEDWNHNELGNEDEGNSVYSISNGIVREVGNNSSLGNFIIIEHLLPVAHDHDGTSYNSVYSLYAHLKSQDVVGGTLVSKGQFIGALGKEGADNAHLHFEMFFGGMPSKVDPNLMDGYEPNGAPENYVSPTNFIQENGTLGEGTDLSTQNVNIQGPIGPGDSSSVSFELANPGLTEINYTSAALFLSTDPSLSADDTPLATVDLLGYWAGGPKTINETIAIPDDTPSGTYYVVVKVDSLDSLAETNEGNNIAVSASFQVTGPSGPLADIQDGGSMLSDVSLFSGQFAKVWAFLTNWGETFTGFFQSRILLSDDQVASADDTVIGSFTTGTSSFLKLIEGESQTQPSYEPSGISADLGSYNPQVVSLAIPSNHPTGPQYVLLQIDSNNDVNESNENNTFVINTATISSAATPEPDLVPVSMTPSTTSINVGDTISLTYSVQNVGSASAGTTYTYYAISDDPIITPDDFVDSMGPTGSLGVGGTFSETQQFVWPADKSPGTYYLAIMTDVSNLAAEGDEINNWNAPVAITVGNGDDSRPDLTADMTSVSSSTLVIGSTYRLDYSVSNEGGSQAGQVAVKFYLSTDQVIDPDDRSLGTERTSGSLDATGTAPGDHTFGLASDIVPGEYFILAQVDSAEEVDESNEQNNVSNAIPVTVEVAPPPTTDISVSFVGLSDASVYSGQAILIEVILANSGDADVPASHGRLYLSLDSNVTIADTPWGNSIDLPEVLAGTSEIFTVTVIVPAGLDLTTHYVGFLADSSNIVSESNEGNNWGPINPMTVHSAPSTPTPTLGPGVNLVTAALGHFNEEFYWQTGPDGSRVIADYDDATYAGPWDSAEFISYLVYQLYGLEIGRVDSGRDINDAGGGGTDPNEVSVDGWFNDLAASGILTSITLAEARTTPGAILFDKDSALGHMAISMGNGQVIHATAPILDGWFWSDNNEFHYSPAVMEEGVDIGDVRVDSFDDQISGGYLAVKINGVDYSPLSPADDFEDNALSIGFVDLAIPTDGEIELAGDEDWFLVFIESGKDYLFDVQGASSGYGTLIDPYINGVFPHFPGPAPALPSDIGGEGLDAAVSYHPDWDGFYWVSVRASDSGTGTYRLSVSAREDSSYEWIGTPQGDVEHGGSNHDTLDGLGGDDWLFGEAKDDLLSGGPGADYLDGGLGNDDAVYSESNASVSISLSSGLATGGDAEGDVLVAIENLQGSPYQDFLEGDSQINRLFGNGEDDTLQGLGAGDLLSGGEGNDTALYSSSPYGVSINLATKKFSGGDASGDYLLSIENVTGSSHEDYLTGDSLANILDGAGGNDLLQGLGGSDHLRGGVGEDTASYASSPLGITIMLWNGSAAGGDAEGDVLSGIENLVGSDHQDVLQGDSLVNRIEGGDSDDNLSGLGGRDILLGGDGNDTLEGGSDKDTLYGDEGFDDLIGGSGSDTLYGGLDEDTITAGRGEDLLVGGPGADVLSGNGGRDILSYEGDTAGVIVDLLVGTGFGGDAEGDTFTSINDLIGGDGNDTLSANGASNLVMGGGGDDTIYLRRGKDVAHGDDGNDTIDGSAGIDTIYGDDDDDVLSGGSAADKIYGGDGDDYINGGVGGDYLKGDGGNDTIDGKTGNDRIIGNSGNDILNGNGNHDELFGGGGTDILTGGSGSDQLYGGSGADTFRYDATSWGSDTVHDFEDGVDLIDMNGTGLSFGDLVVTTDGTDTLITAPDSSTINLLGVNSGINGDDFGSTVSASQTLAMVTINTNAIEDQAIHSFWIEDTMAQSNSLIF